MTPSPGPSPTSNHTALQHTIANFQRIAEAPDFAALGASLLMQSLCSAYLLHHPLSCGNCPIARAGFPRCTNPQLSRLYEVLWDFESDPQADDNLPQHLSDLREAAKEQLSFLAGLSPKG